MAAPLPVRKAHTSLRRSAKLVLSWLLMSREPVAALVLGMLMVRSPRASWGRRRSDDLFRGLPDGLSSGRPGSRDADSWLFLPLVLRQRGAAVAPRTGWTAWLPPLFTSWPGRMGGWAPRWRRALLERTAQVRAVVRRAGSTHAPEGVTEHGRGRRRCPLSEGSGDYPDTRNATDAVPAQVGGLTTVWSARVHGAMKSRPVRLLRLQRAAPGWARGVAHRRPGVGRGQHAVPRAVGVRHQPGPAGLAPERRQGAHDVGALRSAPASQ